MCHKTVSQIDISLLSSESSRRSLVSGAKYYPKIRCSERGLCLWPWGDPQPWNTTGVVLTCWPVPVEGQGLRWGLHVGLRLTLKMSETTSGVFYMGSYSLRFLGVWAMIFLDCVYWRKEMSGLKIPFGFSVQNPSVGFMLPKDYLNGWENFRVTQAGLRLLMIMSILHTQLIPIFFLHPFL